MLSGDPCTDLHLQEMSFLWQPKISRKQKKLKSSYFECIYETIKWKIYSQVKPFISCENLFYVGSCPSLDFLAQCESRRLLKGNRIDKHPDLFYSNLQLRENFLFECLIHVHNYLWEISRAIPQFPRSLVEFPREKSLHKFAPTQGKDPAPTLSRDTDML